MAVLYWDKGDGPQTTQELADVVEREGFLTTGLLINSSGQRCFWGVLYEAAHDQASGDVICNYPDKIIALESFSLLMRNGLSPNDNDQFDGNGEERCAEMVRRLRAIL